MREYRWPLPTGEQIEESPEALRESDLYLMHRILATFPDAYAALREAFRARDAAVEENSAGLCRRCRTTRLDE